MLSLSVSLSLSLSLFLFLCAGATLQRINVVTEGLELTVSCSIVSSSAPCFYADLPVHQSHRFV